MTFSLHNDMIKEIENKAGEKVATVFDYLEWRGDVPFSADPFQEVDNLVLAELAYTDFRGIVPSDGTVITLQEASQSFFSMHSREELLADKSFYSKCPFLMDEMAKGGRFGEMKLCWYIDEIDVRWETQISAITFLLPGGSAYVAFRGTDGSVIGWKEDFNFSFLSETKGQSRAIQYLNEIGAKLDCPLLVGGHSKGGNLAVYASAFCDPAVREKILAVYSNDGPGFKQETTDSEEYIQLLPKIVSIIPDTSIIGLLLSSKSTHRVVKSSASGILQHDGLTWQVQRNRFIEVPLSPTAEIIHQTMGSWLEQMDDETRQTFTDTVFFPFEATGMETFSEISDQKWKVVESFLDAAKQIPKEKQKEVLRLLGQLGQLGTQAVTSYLTGLVKGKESEDSPEDVQSV
ncbi:MAG: DUF2974 domain-containing protein [Oscillospiraceae bacterium]|nr:DUF2974 domain-containing protein [Oscillospiraceae bacterium]